METSEEINNSGIASKYGDSEPEEPTNVDPIGEAPEQQFA
jgi:hypothetical protein